MNIYVGNLPYEVSEEDIREVFTPYGEIVAVNVIMDKFTGQTRGFAFVEMSNDTEAEAAITALDGSSLGGRPLKVNQMGPSKSFDSTPHVKPKQTRTRRTRKKEAPKN